MHNTIYSYKEIIGYFRYIMCINVLLRNKNVIILLIFFFTNIIPSLLLANASDIPISGVDNTHRSNYIAWVICNVVKEITGPIGQAVSTVAVIFIGIGLFMGKVSWGLALGITTGMGMLFGAENVVGWISGENFACIMIIKPF